MGPDIVSYHSLDITFCQIEKKIVSSGIGRRYPTRTPVPLPPSFSLYSFTLSEKRYFSLALFFLERRGLPALCIMGAQRGVRRT